MKVIFMGTPKFAVPILQNMYDEKIDIPLVVTQKDKRKGRGKKICPTPVKAKAQELDIEVYQPEKVNDEESLNKLKQISPDFIVVAAYGQILRKDLLDIPKYGCINVHASLLPYYRGAAPINWAIINGEKETGITIMEMSEGLDSGDILFQQKIDILEQDDSQTIHDKLMNVGAILIVKALNAILSGNIKSIPQDNLKATYAKMLNKKMGKIDWNKDGKLIKNLVRGLKPWPCAYTLYKNQNIKIHDVCLCPKFDEGKNGEIVKVSNEGVFVNANDECVVIKELQFPGKRRMKVKEFLRGNKIEVKSVLE